jgi:Flp pilus assembly pilin Flp
VATVEELQYLIRVNDRDLKELKRNVDSVNKSVDKDLGAASTRADDHLKKIANAASVGAGAALVGMGLAARVGFRELEQGQKATAQTEAVLKSTGGAANVTKGQVLDLAGSLMHLSGVDDEAYQSSENLLLTFRGVRNETGKNNDIFNQASLAIANMDESMNHGNTTAESLHATTILVGKALNDPIKGMTALRRVGVSLTTQQQDLVKKLVDSGHTMAAQKIVLGELTKEFGGSAAAVGDTFAGKLSRAKEEGKNLAAELVSGALPAITGLVGVLAQATGWLDKHQTAAKYLIGTVAILAVGILALRVAVGAYNTIAAAGAIVQKLFTTSTEASTAATEGQTVATEELNVALLANPIGIIVVALAALVAAFVIAYQTSGTFRDVVNGVWGSIKSAVTSFTGFFTTTLPDAFRTVKKWVGDHWPEIATLVSGPFAPLVALATNAFGVRSALLGAFRDVRGWLSDTWQAVSGFVTAPFRSIADGASSGFGIPDKIQSAFQGVRHWLTTTFSDVGGAVAGVFKAPINAIIGAIDAIRLPTGIHIKTWHGIPDGFSVDWSTPFNIPQLAAGGIVTAPTLAMIGERGREAVIPLDRPDALAGVVGQNDGGPIVHIEHATFSDPGDAQLVASAVNRALAFRR